MSRFQVLQIIKGEEHIILDTDDERKCKVTYLMSELARIRKDGKIMTINQADRYARMMEKKRKYRKVNKLDRAGNVVAQYPSIVTAAKENGYSNACPVAKLCRNGGLSRSGFRYAFAEEVI